MAVCVAIHQSRRSRFIGDEPSPASIPSTRPIFEVDSLELARRFASQGEIDAFVVSRGVVAGTWVAWPLP